LQSFAGETGWVSDGVSSVYLNPTSVAIENGEQNASLLSGQKSNQINLVDRATVGFGKHSVNRCGLYLRRHPLSDERERPSSVKEKRHKARVLGYFALQFILKAGHVAQVTTGGNPMFTKDELFDLEYAVANLIQDKKDYCATEEGNDQAIKKLEELQAKVQGTLRTVK